MARTSITRVQASRAGTTVPAAVAADVANGNQVDWDERTTLLIKNTNASSTARTVTFTPRKTVDGQIGQTRVESIPAGETQLFGAFDFTDYGTPLQINGEHAEVTILALRA
jgi:hypothetical protein